MSRRSTRRGRTRDRRLVYEEYTEVETHPGSYTEEWSEVGAIWADVLEVPGREQVRAGQLDADQAAVITCDFYDSAAFTVGGRFVAADGRVYEIHGVAEVGYRQAREFRCTVNVDAYAPAMPGGS